MNATSLNTKPRAAKRQTAFHAVQEARAELNRTEAMKLRVLGFSVRAIAERLGVSPAAAHGYIQTTLANNRAERAEHVEDLRAIEHARNEALIARCLPTATSKTQDMDTVAKAAAVVLKAGQSNRELFGLDAPKRQETSATLTIETVTVLRSRLAERRAALAERQKQTPALLP